MNIEQPKPIFLSEYAAPAYRTETVALEFDIRDGETVALGSPGGSTIPTATAQVFLNLLVDGDDLQDAVNRPRMHHQWMPDAVVSEPDTLSPETASELENRGHELRPRRQLGEVHAVRFLAGGTVEAAADPRGPGGAGVVTGEPGSR